MRFKLTIAVFAIFGLIGITKQAASLPGAAPMCLQVAALTPEKMDAIREQEYLERQYAEAERQVQQVFVANGCSIRYAATVGRAAVDNHLPARIVGSLVYVESSCNPEAISPAGAIGIMQINTHVWKTRKDLTDPTTNIEIGTAILAKYVKQSGLREGLHRYNGLGNTSNDYSSRVLYAAQRR
jgi:soluble lytic murein transglycosylase-like protein